MTTTDSRPASVIALPTAASPAGPDSLGGQSPGDGHSPVAAEGQNSPQAKGVSAPKLAAPAGTIDALGGQDLIDSQTRGAAEGTSSPQAMGDATLTLAPPPGTITAPPAIVPPVSTTAAPEGRKTSRDHNVADSQTEGVAAADIPGAHACPDPHAARGAGDQLPPVQAKVDSAPKGSAPGLADSGPGRPAAIPAPAPRVATLLADPLLALAADVLDDLEKVRVANENRLRQLTRGVEDKDGETRGFGLDESHPDVARLAALVGMLGEAEHKAELNLGRLMRQHSLGPWVASQRGVGEKQGARLIAAIGDPYIRPEITRADGTIEPARPRLVSELWALCGYHVLHPGQDARDTHSWSAGVAPRRQRGQKSNWSETARKRAWLVAASCVKQPPDAPYRKVYDATRAKYADAVHAAECIRCGPAGKPALPGSPLSDGHKHARALRAIAKEVLKDLWREARRIHAEQSGDLS